MDLITSSAVIRSHFGIWRTPPDGDTQKQINLASLIVVGVAESEHVVRTVTSSSATYNYLGYINRTLGTRIKSDQLSAMIVLHELQHNTVGDKEGNKALLKIYNNCIK